MLHCILHLNKFNFAAAAKSLQSCPTLRPHRRQPTRLPRPWDSPDKNTGVGCHFLLQSMKVKSESEVAQSCLTLSTPWTATYQAPPSMGFSRQEYWVNQIYFIYLFIFFTFLIYNTDPYSNFPFVSKMFCYI